MKDKLLIIAQERREEAEERVAARRILRAEDEPLDIDWEALEADADAENAEGANNFEEELLFDGEEGMAELLDALES